MSWLARSIANSLNFDDHGDGDDATQPEAKLPDNSGSDDDEVSSPTTPSRGVKEDLSEISKTLTRQFWGVASFLAPPPQAEVKTGDDLLDSEQDPMLKIRDDFAEIGGKFKSGISRLSNNINVSEITKLASNFLQLDDDREKQDVIGSLGDGTAIGVTEEVVAFARDVAMHPETWMDFPLPPDDEDDDDFDLSDAQQEHALAVERFAPRLAALRIELCPGYMTESCFWKIYFVLVHPRLDKNDAVLLSTPQILEARALLTPELKKRNSTNTENLPGKISLKPEETDSSHYEEPLLAPFPETVSEKASIVNTGTSTAPDTKTVASSAGSTRIQIVDKTVTEEKPDEQGKDQHSGSSSLDVSGDKDEDDADDWLKEETETGDAVGKTIPIENDDDVSFSDLEDDDADVPTSYRKSNDSSDKDSRDWVQLGKSSSKDVDAKHNDKDKESNDWLDVDDIIVS
ncbi:uncharacterized protein LOC121791325 isoform X1 [Salvia splendens]|uniref:uncharacterized protein LOC121791325 isoform X1 n=1 Tax=Salvia splendens TaxID=180675 RepID=UPI001C2693C1|nr:uncharacterized protein LOC121791325 isoform X1 [Salvia splendens]